MQSPLENVSKASFGGGGGGLIIYEACDLIAQGGVGGDIRGFSVASGVGWAASGGKEMRGQKRKSGNTP